MRKIFRSGTGRRLFVAFVSLIALYTAAAGFALFGLITIQDGLFRTGERVQGLRTAMDLASAVRDQYAHLAHTIIIGNESHLAFYNKAEAEVVRLTKEMSRFAADYEEKTWVKGIENGTSKMDRIFHNFLLPAVLTKQTKTITEEHNHVLRVMGDIQENTSRLAFRFEASIQELRDLAAQLQRRALLWGVLFLLIAPVLAAWAGIAIGRSVSKPIAKLKEGAERIAAGDLNTRIDIDTQDEFGSLAHQFNTMAASVKEHQRRRLESEKLAGIGRLAAGVAHEINNPLGVILGYIRVLKKKAQGGLAEDLAVIESETLRCKEIVDGLLDISRPGKPGSAPVDLRDLADDVAARLSGSEETCDISILVEGQAATTGDTLKLRQVIFNLVKNAREAAGPGGSVKVQIDEHADCAVLSVSDTGPGIGDDVRDRIFEPFFTTKQGGTGLGLAVSRAVARAHGGDIEIDTTASGARFVLRLPRPIPGGVS
jgi:signal transduction histidine kinase